MSFLIFFHKIGSFCFMMAWFTSVFFQERAAGALANLAADGKCSTEVAVAGGVHALVMLARNCKFDGVQEQVLFSLVGLNIPNKHIGISLSSIYLVILTCQSKNRI